MRLFDRGVNPIKIVLADDCAAVLAKVSTILEKEFEVVAAVLNGEEAVAAVRNLDPDVLVTDISMPILDGLRAACILRDAQCRAKIVFLTNHDDPDFILAARAAGGSGFVTKFRLLSDLIPAIYAALSGKFYVSPSLRPIDG